MRAGMDMTLGARLAAAGFLRSVMTTVSALSSSSRISIPCIEVHVGPEGAKRNAGKFGSTMAMGPCRKSAEEKRSAIT